MILPRASTHLNPALRFAAVGQAAKRSIAAQPALGSSGVRRANASSSTLSAYVGSWTQTVIVTVYDYYRCIHKNSTIGGGTGDASGLIQASDRINLLSGQQQTITALYLKTVITMFSNWLYCFSVWGLCPQTSTRSPPLDPAGGHCPHQFPHSCRRYRVSIWGFTRSCDVSLWMVVKQRAGGAVGLGGANFKHGLR